MSAIVVDASVAAKWFLIEADSAKAAALIGQSPLFAPDLLRVELAAAISRQFRLGVIDLDTAERQFGRMLQIVKEPEMRLVANESLLARAFAIALQIRHALQDCLYVACAEEAGATLVTSDPMLLKRAASAFPFVRAL